eukprot:UN24160
MHWLAGLLHKNRFALSFINVSDLFFDFTRVQSLVQYSHSFD